MFNFTGLKFKDGTEVESGALCQLVNKTSGEVDFEGKAIGHGSFRGHLDNEEEVVPACWLKDSHYLLRKEN